LSNIHFAQYVLWQSEVGMLIHSIDPETEKAR